MNPAAILALLSNLYEQVAQLQAENAALRAATTSPVPDAAVEVLPGIYRLADGTFVAAQGGAWVPGSWGTVDEAVEAQRQSGSAA